MILGHHWFTASAMKGCLIKDPAIVAAMEGVGDKDALWVGEKAIRGMGCREWHPKSTPSSNLEGLFWGSLEKVWIRLRHVCRAFLAEDCPMELVWICLAARDLVCFVLCMAARKRDVLKRCVVLRGVMLPGRGLGCWWVHTTLFHPMDLDVQKT